jgi:hypothetical protein
MVDIKHRAFTALLGGAAADRGARSGAGQAAGRRVSQQRVGRANFALARADEVIE